MSVLIKSISHHATKEHPAAKPNNLTIYTIIAVYIAKFMTGILTAGLTFAYPEDKIIKH